MYDVLDQNQIANMRNIGDTPVHQAVKFQLFECLKLMLARRPDLLYRENSTGRTPAEMAEDAYIAERVKDVPAAESISTSLRNRDAQTFATDYETDKKEEGTERQRIWALVRTILAEKPAKRRLVSLFEANEVAKRLAARKTRPARAGRYDAESEGDEDVEAEETNVSDEVSKFYASATGWGWNVEKDDEKESEE
jgi:hypothetical protein